MGSDLSVRMLVMASGERHSLIVESVTGIPIYSPNLYLTCRIRNASKSHASVAAAAGCLVILLRFCAYAKIDLAQRFHHQHYLEEHELFHYRDYCTYKFDRWGNYNQTFADPYQQIVKEKRRVTGATLHRRLSFSADYLGWFARQHIVAPQREPPRLQGMVEMLLNSRPSPKGRNSNLVDRCMSESAYASLHESIDINSSKNPFGYRVRGRNRLMILLEDQLGIRCGELLNIRISDIDFLSNKLTIIRRADQKDDTRSLQPLVKTNDRELPVASWLVSEIHNYILLDRSKVRGAKKCPYLFVTYKAGPTQGQALSVSAYKKMWSVLQLCSAQLKDVTGHMLRHTWNYRFSESNDSGEYDLTEAQQEAARSRLMGWKEGSGTARTYNRRFIEKIANEASVDLQNKVIARPKL